MQSPEFESWTPPKKTADKQTKEYKDHNAYILNAKTQRPLQQSTQNNEAKLYDK